MNWIESVDIGGRIFTISNTNPFYVHNKFPNEEIKVIQSVWKSGGFKDKPAINFMTWTGKTAGENGDCDDNVIAIFRIKKFM